MPVAGSEDFLGAFFAAPVAADNNLAMGNDAVFSLHRNREMTPVKSRLERRSIR